MLRRHVALSDEMYFLFLILDLVSKRASFLLNSNKYLLGTSDQLTGVLIY
jgi:hypothetical protein